MGEPRNTDGRFSPEYTDEEILAATRAHEPAATSEVAEEVGMTRQGADRRLRRLRDAGRVSSKKIGASLVWFAPEPDRREPTDAARADAVDDATDAPADPPADAHAGESRGIEDALADLRERMPGSGSNLAGRERAARDIFQYLREHGSGQKSDFKEVVDTEATGFGGFDSFWNNCMDSGALLADLPGVNSPGEGGHVYTYTDDAPEGS